MKLPNSGHLLRYKLSSRTTTRENQPNPLTASFLDASSPSHLFPYRGHLFQYLIDVENPNPGQRPGQIHFQQGNLKYLYDPETELFQGAPNAVNKLLSDPIIQKALQKALRYLGEAE